MNTLTAMNFPVFHQLGVLPNTPPEVSISPTARRKSCLPFSPRQSPLLLTEDGTVNANDRRERRKTNLLLQGAYSPGSPSQNRRRSQIGTSSGLSNTQIAEHYSICIKLSAENKITTKNVFGLHLIDYMADLLKEKGTEMTNFQMAAGTLDASAKIYAVRVDAVHSEAYKMLGGLGREAVPTQGSDAEDSSLASPTTEKQKRQKKKKHTSSNIEENLSSITLTKLDVVEPHLLLDKAASSYDEQGVSGLFMNTLECSDSSWQLLFGSELIPLPLETTVTSSCSSTNDVSDLMDLFLETSFDKKELCPSFAFFTFSQSDEDEAAVENHMVKSSQLTFNPNIEPYFSGEEDDDNGNAEWGDHVEGDGDEDLLGDDFVDDCKAPWMKTASDAKRDIVMSVADVGVAALSQKLALNPGEYSYFNPKVMEGWVGPDHWTLRPFRKLYDQTQKKPKKVFELDFSKDADFEEDFHKSKVITVICKSTLLKRSTQATTLPDDLHYDPSNFLRLYLKPTLVLKSMLKDQVVAESDEGVQEYNFNNAHDAVNFCPDLQQDVYGEDDDIEASTDGATMLSSITSMMLSTFNRTDFPSWKLIDEPRKVDRTQLHYARKEKKIDMKKLKELMWDFLLTDNGEKENVEKLPNEKQFSRRVDFRKMCECLPLRLPGKMAKELSVPLTFVSLLHLANEKNLRIHGQEDMCNFVVEQDTDLLKVV